MKQIANDELYPLTFYYSDEKITFFRKKRESQNASQSKKIIINIKSNKDIIVSTPFDVEDELVIQAVKRRSYWISSRLKAFPGADYSKKYINGECHFYLGRRYQLKIVNNPQQPYKIKLNQSRLEINSNKKEIKYLQHKLNHWYKERAERIFMERLAFWSTHLPWVSTCPNLKLRKMKNQWGNCSPQGDITMNISLIKASKLCIDYVLLHELCHLQERQHNDRFYQLLTQFMPNWKIIKKQLDEMAGLILELT